jgi:heterodisulfide reductase subunit C
LEAVVTLSLSPQKLAILVEEVIPDLDDQDLDDLGRCVECGADLFTEGCPSCEFPGDF